MTNSSYRVQAIEHVECLILAPDSVPKRPGRPAAKKKPADRPPGRQGKACRPAARPGYELMMDDG